MPQTPAFLLHKVVTEIDKIADALLRRHFAISYKRFLFLTTLDCHGTLTQHQLAIALGYSDPAISAMLRPLIQDGYIVVEISPLHARKRLVRLTPHGQALSSAANKLLQDRFELLLQTAAVNPAAFTMSLEQLLQATVQLQSTKNK